MSCTHIETDIYYKNKSIRQELVEGSTEFDPGNIMNAQKNTRNRETAGSLSITNATLLMTLTIFIYIRYNLHFECELSL